MITGAAVGGIMGGVIGHAAKPEGAWAWFAFVGAGGVVAFCPGFGYDSLGGVKCLQSPQSDLAEDLK